MTQPTPSPTGTVCLLRRSYRAALLLIVWLLVAPARAHAGGDFVDHAVGSSRAWFVGEPAARESDANTGRMFSTPQLLGEERRDRHDRADGHDHDTD